MTALRQAVDDYVRMRRNLGFKLQDAGKALLAAGRVAPADPRTDP